MYIWPKIRNYSSKFSGQKSFSRKIKNPFTKSIKEIYYHVGMSDDGKNTEINKKEIVSKNPYIIIYKKSE